MKWSPRSLHFLRFHLCRDVSHLKLLFVSLEFLRTRLKLEKSIKIVENLAKTDMLKHIYVTHFIDFFMETRRIYTQQT